MKLLNHYPSHLKSHDRLVNFSVTGKENITPKFKKVKREHPGKYRLVSLTSAPFKIMEKILLETMPRYMEKWRVIVDNNMASLRANNAWQSWWTFTAGLLHWWIIDLCTAFDTVPAFDTALYDILVFKLERCG